MAWEGETGEGRRLRAREGGKEGQKGGKLKRGGTGGLFRWEAGTEAETKARE